MPGQLPYAITALYLVSSVAAFIVYLSDKKAAKRGHWRIPESTLHLIALVGGWPGALIAQQLFRHKTKKVSFRIVFWLTVFINVTGTAWLCSHWINLAG